MKKSLKIALIAICVIAIIIAIVLLCCFVFVKDKTKLSADKFKTSMEQKGYTVKDITYQFSADKSYKTVYTATDKDEKYKIEFYEMSDVDTAKSFFGSNKTVLENSKGDKYSSSSKSLKNFSIYTLTSNEKYKVISRVENTLIYVNVEESYKDTIKDIIKELGY